MGAIAFKNKRNQRQLCSLIHPWVLTQIRKRANKYRKLKSVKVLIIDAALLMESGLYKEMDVNIVVKSTPAQQIKRAARRDEVSIFQAKQRMQFQMPLPEKIKYADCVIDNCGSMKRTERQVKKIWKTF